MDTPIELPDAIYGFGPRFHLADDFHFARAGNQILVQHGDASVVVPVNEWASVVAATSARGENGETYREALELLDSFDTPSASGDFALVLRMRALALAFPRKDDRDELNRIADRFHGLLARASAS